MMVAVHRFRWAPLAMLVPIVVSCNWGGDPSLLRGTEERPPRSLMGRSFDITLYDPAGGTDDHHATIGNSDETIAELRAAIKAVCSAELSDRLDVSHFNQRGGTTKPDCGLEAAESQQALLCEAHWLATLAEAVVPVDVLETQGANGTTTEIVLRTPDYDLPQSVTLLMSIPIQGPSGSATLALWSAVAFQQAALQGAYALDPMTCIDGTLAGTVPGGRDDDGAWDYDGPEVPLSFVVAQATAESATQMTVMAEKAESRIIAAAELSRSEISDPREAVRAEWRGAHDSRLEAANIILGVSGSQMDADAGALGIDEDEASGGAESEVEGDWQVCDGAPKSPEEVRSEDVLRGTGTDLTNEPALGAAVRARLGAEFPALFGSNSDLAGVSNDEFLDALGVSSDSLTVAARRIANEAEVLGRPVVEVPDETMGLPRFTGSSRTGHVADPAFFHLRTIGDLSLNNSSPSPLGHAVTFDYGAPFDSLTATPDYANGSTMAAADALQIAIGASLGRTDLTTWDITASETQQDAMRVLMGSALELRHEVDYRLQACIGEALSGGVKEARIRLYGVYDTAAKYELWWGEAGLECATRGSIEGVPCDPDLLRITASGTLNDPATDSAAGAGFGEHYMEWTVLPADVPLVTGTVLPEDGHIYVINRVGTDGVAQRNVALGGTALHAGPDSGTYSRCAMMPAGAAVGQHMARILAPSPESCSRPQTSCAGLPLDVKLPLEDELTEAGEGQDEIESSFFHYLRVARNAADEADILGQELVRHGLEMDLRAEDAMETIQQICGDVGDITEVSIGSGYSPAACANDAECETGFRCVGAECQPTDVVGLIPDTPQYAALRRCLGGGEAALKAVSLGAEPFCIYRTPDGPCDRSLPGAPEECPAPGVCAELPEYLALQMAGTPIDDVVPLGLANPSIGGAGAANCEGLLHFLAHNGHEDSLTAEEVFSGRWLAHDSFTAAITRLGPAGLDHPQEFSFGSWGMMTTGSVFAGPNTRWPCASRLSADVHAAVCASGGTYSPLSCGNNCADPLHRGEFVELLEGGLAALQNLTGYTDGGFGIELAPSWAPGASATYGAPLPAAARDVNLCSVMGLDPDCLDTATISTRNVDFGETGRRTFRCLESVDGANSGGYTAAEREAYGICPEGAWRTGLTVAGGRALEPAVSQRAARLFSPGGKMQDFLGAWERGEPMGTVARDLTSGFYARSHVEYLRAIELACITQESGAGARLACGEVGDAPIQIDSIEDILELSSRLRCVADSIESTASRLMLYDVPEDIVEQLRTGSVAATYPSYRGTQGRTVSDLRAELESLPAVLRAVARAIRGFSEQTELARSQITVIDLEMEIDEWRTIAGVADQVARCISATAQIANSSPWGAGGAAVSAAAQCVAGMVNVMAAVQSRALAAQVADETRNQTMIGVAMGFGDSMDGLFDLESDLIRSYSRINGLLSQLDTNRSTARRALSRAFIGSDPTVGDQLAVNRVMRARMNTTRVRYERARENAVRMAWLARRGIEQRLGVDLSAMRDDMSLVPPPATWADGVCAMTAIDYGEIRDGLPTGQYADRFVGDYVRMLERFVESYRLDYPFSDGEDLALISLRDDVLGATVACEDEGWNLFHHTSDLEQWSAPCEDGDRCAALIPLAGETIFPSIDRSGAGTDLTGRHYGDAQAYELFASCQDDDIAPVGDITSGVCTVASGGAISETMDLDAGTYIVSWYEKLGTSLESMFQTACDTGCMPCGSDSACLDACVSECLREQCGSHIVATWPQIVAGATATIEGGTATPLTVAAAVVMGASDDPWLDSCNWRRAFTTFVLDEAASVDVLLTPIGPVPATDPVLSAIIAAPQLELVSPDLVETSMSLVPERFFRTTETLWSEVGQCEDTGGTQFRSESFWRWRCEYVCPDGISGTCGSGVETDSATQRCFWESNFRISPGQIERGELLANSGFAYGNFNYRINRLAVNLVGTGIRDCESSDFPSSCYSSGYLQYSLRHDGPYTVRNHLGEQYDAPLFVGNLEHAKALTAERYLTSPVSSADRGLLTDYWREEFRGRPLAGNYTLRIYDTDGLNWQRLEDIQIALGYKYWTRFE